jgi:hypothetical protein
MSAKAKSPFAGIKLTDQTPMSRGLDQQLFSSQLPAKERETSQETGKPASQEDGKPENQETGKVGNQERPRFQQAAQSWSFDLREPATEKQTFTFSLDEVATLDELKLELRRTFDLKTTKYELARLAIHTLVANYQEQGTDSLLIRSLREKQIPGNQETGKQASQKDGKVGNQETG